MKRYNISLEYEQLVMITVAIRHRINENQGKASEYWFDMANDALAEIDKAMKRHEKYYTK